MGLKEKAITGVAWSAIENCGRHAITFVVFLVLARLLEPDDFGLVAIAGVFVAFVQVFRDQGFADAIVQRDKLKPEHLNTAFWTNVGVGVFLTVLGIVLAVPVASLLNQPQLAPIIRWLSLTLLFAALSGVQQALFRRQLAFKVLAIRSLVAVVAGGVAGVIMAVMGCGVWSLVGQQLVNGFVGLLVLWWSSDWRPKVRFSIKHFKELFGFGINVVGINALNFLNRRSDKLLIGYFLGPVALGYYEVAYKLLLTLTQLLTSVTSTVAFPTFSRLQKEPERLRQVFYRVTQLTSLAAFPVFFGITVIAPELVVAVFGEKWVPSVPLMQVLALIGILHSVYYFNNALIRAAGKPSWSLGLTALNSLINVIAFAIAVQWGILAVAVAYVMRGYLLAPLPIWVVKKLIKLNVWTYVRQYVVPLVGSLVMVATVAGFKHFFGSFIGLVLLLVICIILGASVYAVIILLIAPQLSRQIIDIAHLAIPVEVGGYRIRQVKQEKKNYF